MTMLCQSRQKSLYAAALVCAALPGDFVECGVHLGGSARIILDAMRAGSAKGTLHLFDSWQGMSAPTDGDPAILKPGDLKCDCPPDLAGHPQVKIHSGWVSDTLPQLPDQIAFAHIDLDLAQPTTLALWKVSIRIVPKGIIVIDDFSPRFPGVVEAVIRFLKLNPDWHHTVTAGAPDDSITLLQHECSLTHLLQA